MKRSHQRIQKALGSVGLRASEIEWDRSVQTWYVDLEEVEPGTAFSSAICEYRLSDVMHEIDHIIRMRRSMAGKTLLTQEQVDALPDGVEVMVVWGSFQQGPYRYKTESFRGHVCATGTQHSWDGNVCDGPSPISDVGPGEDGRRVWLPVPGEVDMLESREIARQAMRGD